MDLVESESQREESTPRQQGSAEIVVGDTKPRKRTREEMMNGISEAEMEEYRRKKTVADDPMAKLLGKDTLLT